MYHIPGIKRPVLNLILPAWTIPHITYINLALWEAENERELGVLALSYERQEKKE